MNKQHIKYCLDIIMTICFICIMKIMITGIGWHEKLGLIIGGLVILHLILNYRWIKGMASRIFDTKLNFATKFSVVLNILLAVLTVLVIISGILISVTIFKGIAAENRQLWASIHKNSALLIFICISIHIGLHWKMIMYGFRRLFNIKGINSIRIYILRTLSIIIMLLGLFALSNNSIVKTMLKMNKETDARNKSTKVQVIVEYASIMGLFIGGTHYTLKTANDKCKKKTN
ncbi:MAG: DUF4405 domain-containing protein [Clostridium sp.]|uniref:DUF4405 domain-containing protein n=1 Tax=Clostridium sp. TaxID=1506 RepID=UPI002902199A|nr:DUF4405 domain-containing protein [Clostridium sp.]MDU2896658.1 DUF4405 domain-containing protein [Clostridium sp.]MDU3009068.1 DUF4405 domain-containing protein [Clostridium sp.]MDU3039011.1 DUF4405 domain-containing protein [Clostridium sp.]MDU3053109.1 DUF4405 domain-containing protein [Clostridium sp.]